VLSRLLVSDSSVPISAFMRTQLISYRLPKADSALLRPSLFHRLCRFVSFSSGGLASARESLCRGPGSCETARNFAAYSGLRSVGEGGDDASAGQLSKHGLWLVSLDARFRIEAIQFRPRE
jgi:hypothetical protein